MKYLLLPLLFVLAITVSAASNLFGMIVADAAQTNNRILSDREICEEHDMEYRNGMCYLDLKNHRMVIPADRLRNPKPIKSLQQARLSR